MMRLLMSDRSGLGTLCWLAFFNTIFIMKLFVYVGISSHFCRLLCMALVFVQSLVDLCSNHWLEVLLDTLIDFQKKKNSILLSNK